MTAVYNSGLILYVADSGSGSNKGGGDSPDSYRNPSPPPEILENEEMFESDAIENTRYSKRWLFSTLQKLIEEVEGERNSSAAEAGIDVSEELQDELCKIWDMSMNVSVTKFLHEFKAVDLLTEIISKSMAPRVVEICVGILGNMACDQDICTEMSSSSKLIEASILLLENRDPPALVECLRLMYTSISVKTSRGPWLEAVKKSTTFQNNLIFMFASSTNEDLLRNAAELLDVILDQEEELCEKWATQELIAAQMEALKQIGYKHGQTLEIYFHTFQLFSTSENGVKILIQNASELGTILMKYLDLLCEDEIVGLDGRVTCIASALSVLNILFLSNDKLNATLASDEFLMRIFLKILEPLYPMVHPSFAVTLLRSTSSSSNQDEENQEEEKSSKVDVQPSSSRTKSTGGTNSIEKQHSADNSSNKEGSALDESVDKEASMLFQIMRGFVIDLVSVLLDGNKDNLLKVLKYLNSTSRIRLIILIKTLEPAEEDGINFIDCLQELAHDHNFDRLERIVKENRD